MQHRDVHRVYTRRVNSNGGDVMPAICATICKGVQNQLDKSGCYVLDFFRGKPRPIDTHLGYTLKYEASEPITRTIKDKENTNGNEFRQKA